MLRLEFLNILEKLIPFSSTKDVFEEFKLLDITSDGIQAHDGFMGIQIKCSFTSKIQGSIPADIVFKLLKSITTKEIDIFKEKNKLVFKTKVIKGEIKYLKNVSIPNLDFNMENSQEIPPNFIEAIKTCRFAVANDVALGCRIGIIFLGRYAYALDRYSAMVVDLGVDTGVTYVLNVALANQLIRYGKDLKYFSLNKNKETGENQIVYKVGDDILINGSLFNYNLGGDPGKILAERTGGKKIKLGKFPENMMDILRRQEVILSDEVKGNKRIKIYISDGTMLVRSSSEKGRLSEKIKLDGGWEKGGKIAFSINPLLLQDVLAANPEVTVYPEPDIMLGFKADNFVYYVVGESI